MRLRTAFAALSIVALSAACTREAEAPPEPVQPAPAPAPRLATTVSYACESGQSVAVAYPDASSAQVTWGGRTYTMRSVEAASGARYAGSGLEWWTATRGGIESGTLSRLGPDRDVGGSTLERCSRPSPPAAPGPVPAPRPAPGVVPAAAAPCKGPQLKLSNDAGDAGMGHRRAIMALQNVGTAACSLTGYPAVTLLDGRGQALTSVRANRRPGSYFSAGQAPTPVTLRPRDKAFFDLAWTVIPDESEGETTCPTAARIRLTAPDDTSPVALAQTFTPCGGEVDVSPFRPVAELRPAA